MGAIQLSGLIGRQHFLFVQGGLYVVSRAGPPGLRGVFCLGYCFLSRKRLQKPSAFLQLCRRLPVPVKRPISFPPVLCNPFSAREPAAPFSLSCTGGGNFPPRLSEAVLGPKGWFGLFNGARTIFLLEISMGPNKGGQDPDFPGIPTGKLTTGGAAPAWLTFESSAQWTRPAAHDVGHNPYRAARVGEAINPGPPLGCTNPSQQPLSRYFPRCSSSREPLSGQPSQASSATSELDASQCNSQASKEHFFSVEIINPTSVLNKVQTIVDRPADLFFLAETAAVAATQHRVSQQLRRWKYQAVWSPPVAAHCHGDQAGPSMRGCAVGSAIWSRFSLRPPFQGLAPPVAATQRICVAYSRIGALHFRCIAVYGWPANHAQAKQLNDSLLQQVLDIAADGGVPTLIAGDFNVRPQSLACWPAFQNLGYQEVHELWSRRGHTALPPTCKGATFNDTALLPPVLLNLLARATVDDVSCDFDAHAPLRLQFRLPGCSPTRSVWRKPQCWMEFRPSAPKVHEAYQACAGHLDDLLATGSTAEDVDMAFQTWAGLVEDAVDQALAEQHREDPVQFPHGGLPKSHRGRCVYRQIKQRPCPAVARRARHGDFDPPEEAITVQARARTKQVRRLRTFLCSVQSAARRGQGVTPAVHKQLANEWKAICNAHGYGRSFAQWLLAFDHFDVFYSPCPDDLFVPPPETWLREVVDAVQHDCCALTKQEARHRQLLFRYRNHLDVKQGSSKVGYAALRPHARPPFTAIPVQETQAASLQSASGPGVGWYVVPEPAAFNKALPLTCVHGPVTIQAAKEDDAQGQVLQLRFLNGQSLPPHVVLHQDTEASSAAALNRQFMLFWHPIWARDRGPALQESAWQDFLDELPTSPPQCQHFTLDLLDLDLWRDHARQLKVRSATGYCGFSNRALRWLPDGPLWHLAQLFDMSSRCGFPAHMARATVHTLAKVDVPQSMKDGRPITVFSNLYRLWSSLCSRSLLRAWAQWLPAAVAGSVPARSVRDVSLAIQIKVETALLERKPLAGLSVDIIKCFNQLPRAPLVRLLQHLGVPRPVLAIWSDFLAKALRHAVFLDEIGHPVGGTTGVPEGCPLSVLCMVALCWYLAALPRPADADLFTYVDNLSWAACCPSSLQNVLETALRFCRNLLLPIDWKKSFAWATASKLKRWWEGTAPGLLPEGAQLQVVKGAKDLGVQFRFSVKGSPGSVKNRLEEGRRRLCQLQSLCRNVFNKARLIQSSVWPATFYGMEGSSISLGAVQGLRSAAAHAMLGPHRAMSPHLALSAITPIVDDPAVYLLSQALCALQRQLQVQPHIGEAWLQRTVSALSGPAINPFGPATRLAQLLRQAGWSLDAEGLAKGPGHTWCSLRFSPAQAVRAAVRQAWREQIPTAVAHRNGMTFAQVPAPHVTHAVLRQFDDGAQVHLARIVVGALLSDAAKATWDPLQSPLCALCGATDTKHHRLLHCPATLSARRPFMSLLEVIDKDCSEWFHCPYPGGHAAEPFLRLLWRSRSIIAPARVVSDIPSLTAAGEVHMFTDGTCAHPTCPEARHAAWAVLLYVGPWPFPSAWVSQEWGHRPAASSWFAVVAQGVVPGVQTISRAEVLALCQAAWISKQFAAGTTTVWSDSLTALRLARSLQQGQARACHFASDLLAAVPHGLFQDVKLRKIAAHQHAATVPSELILPTVGNHLADGAAKHARVCDLETATSTCEEVAEHVKEQHDRFLGFCQYQMALLQVAKPLRQEAVAASRIVYGEADLTTGAVEQRWSSLQGQTATEATEIAAVQLLTSGADYTTAVETWSSLLTWPSDDEELHAFAGITHLELLFNFVVCTGRIPHLGATGPSNGVDLLSAQGILQPLVLREVVVAFVLFIRGCERRLGRKLLRGTSHRRIRSLEFVGFGASRKGFLQRPCMPKCGETIRCAQIVLSSSSPGESLRDFALQLSQLQ